MMATGSVIFSPFGNGSVLISSGAGFEPGINDNLKTLSMEKIINTRYDLNSEDVKTY